MPLSVDEFGRLEAFTREIGGSRERECGDLLALDVAFLFPMEHKELQGRKEYRNRFGDGDLVIVASILNDSRQQTKLAYLWELKSPQSAVMERDDDDNRFRPSKELIKAETQLIHYYYDVFGSDVQRSEIGVMERENIRMGGIIIGTTKTFVRGAKNIGDIERAQRSLNWRRDVMYDKHKIRIMTWDRVLDFLRPV